MSNLIDKTYFIGGGLDIPISSKAELNEGLMASIIKYEPEILKKLLGYKLYKLVQDAYDASLQTLNPVALPQIYADLINGAEFSFEYCGVTIETKWEGLRNATKESLIANYVYYWHRRNNVSQFNGVGETVGKVENSTAVVNPRYKMKAAWNKFVELYGETGYCGVNNATYAVWNDYPSAYNFLLANRVDYPDWKFEPQEMDYSL
jgi:hypothetical protein